VRDFFGLAAEQMRRELLDLARYFKCRRHLGARHEGTDIVDDLHDALADPGHPDDLERWTEFHEGVANLPPREREVVALIFYHGWTQAQVAELLSISERTVRRIWDAALLKLRARRSDGESSSSEKS
jgi:RNA polymerase sigma-70 factor (ECF subfamily)